jgi:hypothetical protein
MTEPVKSGRLLYPTVYLAREGLIMEARQALANSLSRLPESAELSVRYDPAPEKVFTNDKGRLEAVAKRSPKYFHSGSQSRTRSVWKKRPGQERTVYDQCMVNRNST